MKKIFLLSAYILAFISCSNDDVDTTKPTIDLVTPVEETIFHPGDEIAFECNFSDNKELASYKIEIHSNFDGHEHTSAQLKSEDEDHGHAWTYEKEWAFEDGLSSTLVSHQEIVVPETVTIDGEEEEIAEGHYHLGVYCLDEAGNQAEIFIEIEIEHIE